MINLQFTPDWPVSYGFSDVQLLSTGPCICLILPSSFFPNNVVQKSTSDTWIYTLMLTISHAGYLRWLGVCDHLYKYAAFGEFVLPTKNRAERLVRRNKNILLYLSGRIFLNLSGGVSRLIPPRAKILQG